jgi:hypothetical protein
MQAKRLVCDRPENVVEEMIEGLALLSPGATRLLGALAHDSCGLGKISVAK